jgi:hypothetical protein
VIVEIEYYWEYPVGEVTLEKAYEMAKLLHGVVGITISHPIDWRESMVEEYETDKLFYGSFGLEVPYDLQEEIWYTEELLEALMFLGAIEIYEFPS